MKFNPVLKGMSRQHSTKLKKRRGQCRIVGLKGKGGGGSMVHCVGEGKDGSSVKGEVKTAHSTV